MDKIQQFFILKIQSGRLKESKYNIKNLTLDQARKNGEVVSLANSQMIRTIQKITNKNFSQYELDKLLEDKKRLSRQKNKKENRKLLGVINRKIDDTLYIPQIISVLFEDKRHFINILNKNGFLVNGIRYVPFLASAGMLRRDTYLFIDESIKSEITKIFENNRNPDVEYAPAKFSAYYSLYSSSTLPVSFPKIVVVPDLTIKTIRTVDYSTYLGEGIDPKIEEREMELECNAFDGQGIVSPSLAKKWAKELGLDYLPSIFGIRAPYLKGMVCVFPIKEFAEQVAKKNKIIDIYGEEFNINDVECIVSESQFKLWESYSNTKEYIDACSTNGLDFGITQVNPKETKNHAKTSYQFLQILNLNNEQIENLCKPTLDWLNNVSSGDVMQSLLFSMGEVEFSKGWFNRLDATTQALLLENSLINDSYFISHLDKSIAKKKNDAKIGRLYFNGNYSTMISDPYAQMSHVLGMGINSLLNDKQHYSGYWNSRGVEKVAAIRSPAVHSSEVNILNFIQNDETETWYKYLQYGIVYPANGIGLDAAIHGGSDNDLDLVCTINSQEIIDGKIENLPIFYETTKAKKQKIVMDDKSLVMSQVNQIKSNKIGFITNLSSTFYSLLENFNVGTPEHTSILNRLKQGRVEQGTEIDRTKGLLVHKFPEHFAKWRKIKDDTPEDEKEFIKFNNSIVGNRRPLFMRWLYSHMNRRYLRERSIYDNISQTKWGIPFSDLEKSISITDEQRELVEKYKRKSFFINNNSVMNRISRYVEESLKEIKSIKSAQQKDFDYAVLLSRCFQKPLKRDLDKMLLLFKEWKSLNRSIREKHLPFGDDDSYQSFDQVNSYANKKAYSAISSNGQELSDLAIYMCYNILGKQSKSFAWKCFGKEIVQVLKSKKKEKFIRVPMMNKKGSLEYLWSRFGIYNLNIEDS